MIDAAPRVQPTVTLLTTGGPIIGRLASAGHWHHLVRRQADQTDELHQQLEAGGVHKNPRDTSLGQITQYYLLDATIQPPGLDRSAYSPPRPWIVQARHVIAWTFGDAFAASQ